MKKAAIILNGLKHTDKYYKEKVKILSEIINEPKMGHLCPDKLVSWCDKVGLKTRGHCEDKISWHTVSGS